MWHKPYKKPSVFRKTMTSGIDDQWQADLVEMRDIVLVDHGRGHLVSIIVTSMDDVTGSYLARLVAAAIINCLIATKVLIITFGNLANDCR
jgi:hypothetical protein